MSRLWSRSGLRLLSITMLLVGLVAGGYLSSDRHDQQIAAARSNQAKLDLAYQQQMAQQQAAAYQAGAPLRSQLAAAQAAAQKQANASASAAAKSAQKAESDARKAKVAQKAKTASRSSTRSTPPPSSGGAGPTPKSCSSYSGNRATGCTILLSEGYALSQMSCLDKMWTRESNWRTTAENPSSHSYGIPQALPASKMSAFGSDYRTNPVPQIKWGLSYIKGRYNTPCGAWSFWQAHNWY